MRELICVPIIAYWWYSMRRTVRPIASVCPIISVRFWRYYACGDGIMEVAVESTGSAKIFATS